MGLSRWSGSSTIGMSRTDPPNPNPRNFHVEQEEVVAGKSILLVRYDGCITFNGLKLLLLRQRWEGCNSLDPHLFGGGHIVLARFEPNEQGWIMARLCAEQSNLKQ